MLRGGTDTEIESARKVDCGGRNDRAVPAGDLEPRSFQPQIWRSTTVSYILALKSDHEKKEKSL